MVRKKSAAEMLAEAREVYERVAQGPGYPGRERFLRETRRRIEMLERSAGDDPERMEADAH